MDLEELPGEGWRAGDTTFVYEYGRGSTGDRFLIRKPPSLVSLHADLATRFQQAYEEEGLACPDIDERVAPTTLLYPRSFVDAVDEMPDEKVHDYCFMGSLYRSETLAYRDWILDFAKERFTEQSYLLLSESPPEHVRLGPFDHTGDQQGVFVPKEVPWGERAFFNPHYFATLRRSQFTLCPAGDRPWSMRFFEAIMCRSIPVVSDASHVGRNELERSIGYRVLLRDEEHAYDDATVEENYQRFVKHQTLLDGAS